MKPVLTPAILLSAYAQGYFPMARAREDKEILWFNPEERGIIPLDKFHIPRSLKKFLKKHPFDIHIDTAFEEVMRACSTVRHSFFPARSAGPAEGGRSKDSATARADADTWINDEIIAAYTELHHLGFAHSVECWQDDALMGGLYGVTIGGAFFGESMFSRAPNASKVALVHLVERLRACGFQLLDAQFENAHLNQFGATVIPREHYLHLLENALKTSDNPSTRFLMASPSSA